ncbi:MAG: AbrB/MazE/SpoVT family DNA-binding domain-containing protein [Clostridia bacterium]|nr:AbrB/MazE/SpoVT family DNA-binding domain-containing protein [Clostridia bacterium]
MKSLGIVRQIDVLGRIVLPIEMRKRLDLSAGDGVEMIVEHDKIVLKKFAPACIFCGGSEDIVEFGEKKICKKCLEELKALEN